MLQECTPRPGYSTNEVDTGEKWIDGKRIYKKTFSKTFTSSDAGVWTDIGAVDSSMNLIKYEPLAMTSAGTIMLNNSGYCGNSANAPTMYNSLVIRISDNKLQGFAKSLSGTPEFPMQYYITLYYTKS